MRWNLSLVCFIFIRISPSLLLSFTFFVFPSSIAASQRSRCIFLFLDLAFDSISFAATSRREFVFSSLSQFPTVIFPSSKLSASDDSFIAAGGFHAFLFFPRDRMTSTLFPFIVFSCLLCFCCLGEGTTSCFGANSSDFLTSESVFFSDDESEDDVDVSDELEFLSFKCFIADGSLPGDGGGINLGFFLSGSSLGLCCGVSSRGGSFFVPFDLLSGCCSFTPLRGTLSLEGGCGNSNLTSFLV
mmetsp:Transcript_22642/g.34199  ORF Transcript_22642/g.34199 Transcript_22642/m.34199 type:complete len:243 (+) Transcript_22642:74-802(+)